MKIKRCFKKYKKENITITILHYVGKFLDNMNGSKHLKDDFVTLALISFYMKLFKATVTNQGKNKTTQIETRIYKILEFEPKLKFDMQDVPTDNGCLI